MAAKDKKSNKRKASNTVEVQGKEVESTVESEPVDDSEQASIYVKYKLETDM